MLKGVTPEPCDTLIKLIDKLVEAPSFVARVKERLAVNHLLTFNFSDAPVAVIGVTPEI